MRHVISAQFAVTQELPKGGTPNQPAMSAAQVTAFLDREFPQLLSGHGRFVVESVGLMSATVRLIYDERHLRPGGTLSGPSMFGLCDLSLYIAILAQIGPVALAVTTNININFLRRPQARDLIGECRLMKLGKRLAVGEVWVYPEGSEEPVAHATGTYSIPPR